MLNIRHHRLNEVVLLWYNLFVLIEGASERALQLRKHIYLYSEDMCSVLNCHDVARHAEFYLG
jgi:hypothetical protein